MEILPRFYNFLSLKVNNLKTQHMSILKLIHEYQKKIPYALKVEVFICKWK